MRKQADQVRKQATEFTSKATDFTSKQVRRGGVGVWRRCGVVVWRCGGAVMHELCLRGVVVHAGCVRGVLMWCVRGVCVVRRGAAVQWCSDAHVVRTWCGGGLAVPLL